MTTSLSRREGTHRPLPVRIVLWLLVFLGVTALGGGTAMVSGVGGDDVLPSEWLAEIPMINSWLLPGLVLGIGFGLGSLLVAYGVARRPRWTWPAGLEKATGFHWAWIGTVLIGLGHVVWIGLELLMLPEFSWLQALYGPLGLALLLMPFLPAVRRYLALNAVGGNDSGSIAEGEPQTAARV